MDSMDDDSEQFDFQVPKVEMNVNGIPIDFVMEDSMHSESTFSDNETDFAKQLRRQRKQVLVEKGAKPSKQHQDFSQVLRQHREELVETWGEHTQKPSSQDSPPLQDSELSHVDYVGDLREESKQWTDSRMSGNCEQNGHGDDLMSALDGISFDSHDQTTSFDTNDLPPETPSRLLDDLLAVTPNPLGAALLPDSTQLIHQTNDDVLDPDTFMKEHASTIMQTKTVDKEDIFGSVVSIEPVVQKKSFESSNGDLNATESHENFQMDTQDELAGTTKVSESVQLICTNNNDDENGNFEDFGDFSSAATVSSSENDDGDASQTPLQFLAEISIDSPIKASFVSEFGGVRSETTPELATFSLTIDNDVQGIDVGPINPTTPSRSNQNDLGILHAHATEQKDWRSNNHDEFGDYTGAQMQPPGDGMAISSTISSGSGSSASKERDIGPVEGTSTEIATSVISKGNNYDTTLGINTTPLQVKQIGTKEYGNSHAELLQLQPITSGSDNAIGDDDAALSQAPDFSSRDYNNTSSDFETAASHAAASSKDDDASGDFDAAQSHPQTVTTRDNDDDNFGSFDAAPPQPQSTVKSEDDDFGDFDEAASDPRAAAKGNDGEDFGNFHAVSLQPQSIVEGDDDDFGDFDTAPSDPRAAAKSEDGKDFGSFDSAPLHPQTTVEGDDDDFGDFDEAPAYPRAVVKSDDGEDFGDFHAVPPQPQTTVECDDDDFGDFDEAPADPQATAKSDDDEGFGNFAPPMQTVAKSDGDDFGDFNVAPSQIAGQSEYDDFGGFDEAHSRPSAVATTGDEEDFGDFGDFDSSPIQPEPTTADVGDEEDFGEFDSLPPSTEIDTPQLALTTTFDASRVGGAEFEAAKTLLCRLQKKNPFTEILVEDLPIVSKVSLSEIMVSTSE